MNKRTLAKVTNKVQGDLLLSRANLDQQMCRQASLCSYYAVKMSGAVRDEKRVLLRLEMLETQIYRRLSQVHSRVTEKMLLAECHTNHSWLRLKQFHNEAAHSSDVLKGVCQALLHKKDMLVNLGASVRAEMAGEVSTKTRS